VAKIFLTEKAIALEEVVEPFNLTGYLEVDSKTIPTKENYRYSISGPTSGYETVNIQPEPLEGVGFYFLIQQICSIISLVKPKGTKEAKEMKKDDTVRNLLESKFDRETLGVL
jgi:hypothetical protein